MPRTAHKGIAWDDLVEDLATKRPSQIAREQGCTIGTVKRVRASRGLGPPWPRADRGDGRERFSVRLTPGQFTALWRTRGGGGVSERIRGLITAQLDGPVWPEFVDPARDEGARTWVQIRLSGELRAAIHGYQQAVGCRDLSAAVRSLVTNGLVMEAVG